ncbi:hypothetical protein J6590_022919 [Homalodisca vitripennis]|nr:hypothetical protein J6590_022919 [Homalodisca vitripennis]
MQIKTQYSSYRAVRHAQSSSLFMGRLLRTGFHSSSYLLIFFGIRTDLGWPVNFSFNIVLVDLNHIKTSTERPLNSNAGIVTFKNASTTNLRCLADHCSIATKNVRKWSVECACPYKSPLPTRYTVQRHDKTFRSFCHSLYFFPI